MPLQQPSPHRDKRAAYAELVAARKKCRNCAALSNPAAVADGQFDSDHVGPYTRWQANLDADLLVVGQDFADVETFVALRGWPGAAVQTNLTLVKLLSAAGIEIEGPARRDGAQRVFLTNAVLCLKRGGMQAPVPAACFRTCGTQFLRPTIELVAPRAIAALGRRAFDATLEAFGLRRDRRFTACVEDGVGAALPCGATVFAMCHPSRTVLNTVRSFDQQRADWQRLGRWLAQGWWGTARSAQVFRRFAPAPNG